MNDVLILAVCLFSLFKLNAQDSTIMDDNLSIVETITAINKVDLFEGWEEMTGDQTYPTWLKTDLNGDEKIDLVGFYSGVEHGLFIFGNSDAVDGEMEELYKQNINDTWFENNKFQAVIVPILAGEKILYNETNESIVLDFNSALIKKSDGSKIVLTLIDDEWVQIKIK